MRCHRFGCCEPKQKRRRPTHLEANRGRCSSTTSGRAIYGNPTDRRDHRSAVAASISGGHAPSSFCTASSFSIGFSSTSTREGNHGPDGDYSNWCCNFVGTISTCKASCTTSQHSNTLVPAALVTVGHGSLWVLSVCDGIVCLTTVPSITTPCGTLWCDTPSSKRICFAAPASNCRPGCAIRRYHTAGDFAKGGHAFGGSAFALSTSNAS